MTGGVLSFFSLEDKELVAQLVHAAVSASASASASASEEYSDEYSDEDEDNEQQNRVTATSYKIKNKNKTIYKSTKSTILGGTNSRGQPMSNLLWALAQLQVDFFVDFSPSLQADIMSLLYTQLSTSTSTSTDTDTERSEEYTDQAVTVVLLSLCKMGVKWVELPIPMQSALSRGVCRICLRRDQDMANTQAQTQTQKNTNTNKGAAGTREVRDVREREISPQSVANLVYALGKMGAVKDSLTDRMKVALEIAIKKAARASASGQNTRNSLNAHDTQNIQNSQNDDAIQILYGLSLMRYQWPPRKFIRTTALSDGDLSGVVNQHQRSTIVEKSDLGKS